MLIGNHYKQRNTFNVSTNMTTSNPMKRNAQAQVADSISFRGNHIGELTEFVNKYSKRIPVEQICGDDINLTFFGVRKIGEPPIEKFKNLAEPIKAMLDKRNGEVSYIELGPVFDSQGTALQTMGLGHLLGEWKVLSPDTVTGFLPAEVKKHLAGMGMVTIKNI